jgi:hypothetical protein
MDDRHHVDGKADTPALRVIRRAEARGVVHQHVAAADRGGGFGDVAADRRRIGQVANAGMRDRAEGIDFGAGLLQRFLAARADGYRRAGAREAERDRATDPAAAAADDGPFAGEVEYHGDRLLPR